MNEEFTNILVPVDGSEPSRHALAKAVYLAQHCDAKLTLLYVVDMNKNINAFEQVSTGGYIPTELKEQGYKVLLDLSLSVPTELRPGYIVQIGDPGKAIVAFSEEKGHDLIIIGNRGATSYIKQILIGSVSQYVLLRSHCPVLIVK